MLAGKPVVLWLFEPTREPGASYLPPSPLGHVCRGQVGMWRGRLRPQAGYGLQGGKGKDLAPSKCWSVVIVIVLGRLYCLDSAPTLQFPHCVTLGQPPCCSRLPVLFHKEKVDSP